MMAIPTSPSKLGRSASAKKVKVKSPDNKKEKAEKGITSPAKRKSNPGIRMIHGRIYDSENGKTCHQCRQKTRDFTAACKNLKNNKSCPINFCHKCLLNRYGEKAEEVGALQEWVCPKCRGICNCSFCMKKRGHQPTGILIRAAKASGYSSVSEMLQTIGPDNYQEERSAKKRAVLEMVPETLSPRKRGKENTFDGQINDSNSFPLPSLSNLVQDKSKKVEVEGSNELNDSANDPVDGNVMPRKPKKLRKTRQERNKKECDSVLEKSNPPDGGVTFTKRSSPRKHHFSYGTENSDAKSNIQADPDERKLSKEKDLLESVKKKKGKQEIQDGNKNTEIFVKRTSPRKQQISNGISKETAISNIVVDLQQAKFSMAIVYEEGLMEPSRKDKEEADKQERSVESGYGESNNGNGTPAITTSEDNNKQEWRFENNDINAEIPLPEGFELTSVHDIEIPPGDVGKALQLMEFCAVFGKILGFKKGQAAFVLRDLLHGRSSRRGKQSATAQFIIQMLSVIQEERGQGDSALKRNGRSAWIDALNECISESGSVSKSLDLDSLDNGAGGFECLDSSKKLKIINFLCDEILETTKIRDWIESKSKEDKEKVNAAKNKERSLRQKMQDEIAKVIIQKNGDVLSISEHDAIISKIKREAAAAHSQLELNDLPFKKDQYSDVMRTQPIYLGSDGHAFWKLKCMAKKSGSELLLQDVGSGDTTATDEKWFGFEDEQREVIEKRINSSRGKRLGVRRDQAALGRIN